MKLDVLADQTHVHPVQVDLTTMNGPATGDDGVAATVARAGGVSADKIAARAAAESSTGRFTYPQEIATSYCCSLVTVQPTSPAATSLSTAD
jgi:hypothetical protein